MKVIVQKRVEHPILVIVMGEILNTLRDSIYLRNLIASCNSISLREQDAAVLIDAAVPIDAALIFVFNRVDDVSLLKQDIHSD